MTILLVRPIRIAAGTVKSVGILAPSICCWAWTHHSHCHAVVVNPCVSLVVNRSIWVWSTVLLVRHYSVLVLVADLWITNTLTTALQPSYLEFQNKVVLKGLVTVICVQPSHHAQVYFDATAVRPNMMVCGFLEGNSLQPSHLYCKFILWRNRTECSPNHLLMANFLCETFR